MQEPRWNSPPFTDKIATDRPGFDAAIIVMSSELLNYAETIESRLQRQIALTTHIIVLKEESHANACVEDLNNKGVLYAFLVNSQNEKHFSCTLRILYGSPQGWWALLFMATHGLGDGEGFGYWRGWVFVGSNGGWGAVVSIDMRCCLVTGDELVVLAFRVCVCGNGDALGCMVAIGYWDIDGVRILVA